MVALEFNSGQQIFSEQSRPLSTFNCQLFTPPCRNTASNPAAKASGSTQKTPHPNPASPTNRDLHLRAIRSRLKRENESNKETASTKLLRARVRETLLAAL